MPEYTMKKLGLKITFFANFTVRMADHHEVTPLGIASNVVAIIQGSPFSLDFVVLDVPTAPNSYTLLIGHPWLCQARALHDWGSDKLWIASSNGHHELHIDTGTDATSKNANVVVISTIPYSSDGELLEWLGARTIHRSQGLIMKRLTFELKNVKGPWTNIHSIIMH